MNVIMHFFFFFFFKYKNNSWKNERFSGDAHVHRCSSIHSVEIPVAFQCPSYHSNMSLVCRMHLTRCTAFCRLPFCSRPSPLRRTDLLRSKSAQKHDPDLCRCFCIGFSSWVSRLKVLEVRSLGCLDVSAFVCVSVCLCVSACLCVSLSLSLSVFFSCRSSRYRYTVSSTCVFRVFLTSFVILYFYFFDVFDAS